MKTLKLAALMPVVLMLAIPSSNAALFSKKTPKPSTPTNPPVVVAVPVVTNVPPSAPAIPVAPPVLTWEADVKEYHAKMGDAVAPTTFYLTNTSPVAVVVNSVVTSCGCTTAHLPPMPWTLAPGADGKIDINMNLAGKMGTVIKTITVNSTAGAKVLQFRVIIPDPQVERTANMQLAQADRQAVFKGSCAACHAAPAEGKTGGELFKAVCGVCHEAANRASMVPDLQHLPHPTSRDHWHAWITGGKPGSLMPAFKKTQGGPLSDEQIKSLVDYLEQAIPSIDAAGNPAPLPK
jgi:mono/diheme cytochrome c family protein